MWFPKDEIKEEAPLSRDCKVFPEAEVQSWLCSHLSLRSKELGGEPAPGTNRQRGVEGTLVASRGRGNWLWEWEGLLQRPTVISGGDGYLCVLERRENK